MNKLCNSCEYIRYCARSGIEDIGCDRYKRDATTNEEWFCSLSTEEKAKMLGRVSFCDFCPHQLKERCGWTTGHGEDCIYENATTSEDAWLAWLKEEHKK